jgi:tetratricopeptide (TPR) repeat protein
VVTSDHGEGLGEHGELTHTFFVYESTMHVPLILWGPAGLPSGKRIGSLVRTVDLLPTLLDWLELPPVEDVQGRSLRALVDGDRQDLGLVAYGESVDLFRIFGTTPLRSLRDGRWKYIHKVQPELYDLESDPAELENLATTRADVAARLRDQLQTLLAESAAPPSDASVTIPSTTQRELAALGYLAPAAGARLPDELSSLEEFGADPATLNEDLTRISSSKGLLLSQQWERATERLRPLLEKHPQSGHVAGLMARALLGSGDIDAAIALFRRASELEPHVDSHIRRLVEVLNKQERSHESVEVLNAFLEQNPCNEMRKSLNQLLHRQQRYPEQFAALAKGVRLCPESGRDLNNFAWALATSPDDALRDGEMAVELAQRAIANTDGEPTPNFLDTLAAAYAETGDFDAATRETQRAIEILERSDARRSTIFAYRRRLAELEAKFPIRD